MKIKTATIGELRDFLIMICDEYGEDCTWNGWDTGELIIYTKEEIIKIDCKDDHA